MQYLSLDNRGGAIQSEVGVAMIIKENLQYIQHTSHLGEYQDPGKKNLAL